MKSIINTKKAPAAVGPYSQAVMVDGFLFGSGQIPLIPETGEMEEACIEKQTLRVLSNIKAVLDEAGMTPADVIKTTVFLTDLANFGKVNELYAQIFSVNPPARSCIQVAGLPKGALVEMEFIARKAE